MTRTVSALPAAVADDEAVVGALVRLVNAAYAIGEAGLWRDGWTRTTAADIAERIRGGIVRVATDDGRITGCACVRRLDAATADVGLISVAPEAWGGGLGGALVDAAEAEAREHGAATMQLELLVPRAGSHPGKERSRGWYERLGYRVERTVPFEEVATHAAADLAVPCAFLIFRKPLGARSESAAG